MPAYPHQCGRLRLVKGGGDGDGGGDEHNDDHDR